MQFERLTFLLFLLVNLSIVKAQNPNAFCTNMSPICTDDILTFDVSNTGGGLVQGNDYDCLVPTVGTNWFYLKVGNSGNIDMTITAPLGFDLDFAVWGPFANLSSAQSACGNLGVAPNPLGTVDCSALGGNTESVNIAGANAGNIYVMLITTLATSGPTTFQLTLDPSSTGTTDCSIACPTNSGTFSLLKGSDPTDPSTYTPTTSPISLCAGEGFSIFSNQDYTLPEDTISYADGGDSIYSAQLMFLLYDTLPTSTDPGSDPGYTGVIIPSDSINDQNSSLSSILDSLNLDCGVVYFVPVTGDDGIGLNNNMVGVGDNGQLNYDLSGNGCLAMGDPIEVKYNCELTATGNFSCAGNNNLLNVSLEGGAIGDVYIFTYRDGILSEDTIQTPDNIQVSNLMHLDTIELYFEDEAGCFDSLKTSFSIPQFVNVNVADANGCIAQGQVSVEGDSLTGNGGLAKIIMNGIVETSTLPFDTLSAIGGTQVLISLEDQAGCQNDTVVTIGIIGGNQLIIDTIPGTILDVSCFGYNDGTATVSAYGVDQFGNPSGVPIVSYVWTHSTGVAVGGTALDSVLINAIPGSWTVTATSANGCTITMTIVINEPDSIQNNNSVIVEPTVGLSNGSIDISVIGGTLPYATYTVIDANGTSYPVTGSLATGLSGGTYTITVEDANGCTGTFTMTLTEMPLSIDNDFDLNDIAGISDLKLFPSRVDNELNVSFNLAKLGVGSITILDQKGAKVFNLENTDFTDGKNHMVLELTELSSGVYFLELKVNSNRQLSKFMKQ